MSSRVILPEDDAAMSAPVVWKTSLCAGELQRTERAAAPMNRGTSRRAGCATAATVRAAGARGTARRECARARRPAGTRAAAEMQPVWSGWRDPSRRSAELRARLRARSGSRHGATCRSRSRAASCGASWLSIRKRCTGWCWARSKSCKAQEICRVRVHPSHAAAITACLRQTVSAAHDRSDSPTPSREPGACDLRNRARQSGRVGGIAAPGDRARSGRPAAGNNHDELDLAGPVSRGTGSHSGRCRWTGQVTEVVGLLVESRGPGAAIGDFCEVAHRRRPAHPHAGDRIPQRPRALDAAGRDRRPATGRSASAARSDDARVEVGPGLLGRVLDGFGKPMDGGPPIAGRGRYTACYGAADQSAGSRAHHASRWSPASAPSTACCPAAKGSASASSAAAASARARCSAPCRGTTRRT